jgi:hypothetical protein
MILAEQWFALSARLAEAPFLQRGEAAACLIILEFQSWTWHSILVRRRLGPEVEARNGRLA